jgi:hypothetical protein
VTVGVFRSNEESRIEAVAFGKGTSAQSVLDDIEYALGLPESHLVLQADPPYISSDETYWKGFKISITIERI